MIEVDRRISRKSQAEDLEFALLSSLNQVEPDPEFVNRLQRRFEQAPSTVIEHRSFWAAYIIVATGLFLGTFMIWLVQYLVRWRAG